MSARVAATAVLAVMAAAVVAAPAAEAARKPGIDVSVYQGKINWSKVARSGERFVFAKATEGITYDDPTWARNRSRAARHGLRVGAYHFARPEGGSSGARETDARREARHYLRVARLRRGHLIPVLDLEVSGGLGCSALKQWTRVWLRLVSRRLGEKGAIYTSPHFWQTSMCDTKWFARRGYRALWIAHWQTSRPFVPAGNWGGRGWTFWQWTSCGSVPGISGCVDRDLYRGKSFKRVTIGGGRRRKGRKPPPLLPRLPGLPRAAGLPVRPR